MAEHDERLSRVLQLIDEYSTTARADKCVIGASEVAFNGHRVSSSGILPLTSNVSAKNQKQLCASFVQQSII